MCPGFSTETRTAWCYGNINTLIKINRPLKSAPGGAELICNI